MANVNVGTNGEWSKVGPKLPVGWRKAVAANPQVVKIHVFTVTEVIKAPVTMTSPAEGVSFGENHVPIYSGKGTPGATVRIEQGPRKGAWYPVGTATVNAFGDWLFIGQRLTANEREARATQGDGGTDFARNSFTVSEVVQIPATLTFPAEGASFDENHIPVYAGKGTPGATVKIEQGLRIGGWRLVGAAIVNTNGVWSYVGLKLPAGEREARATQGDGGTDFARNNFTVTVSKVIEIPSTLTFPAEGASFDENHIPVYAGKGTPGATITIEQGRRTGQWFFVGAAIVNTNGDWSCVGMTLAAGEREARATQSKGGSGTVKNRFTVTK
ncbi:hypothetical protein ACYZTX_11590 [Pseudomonas sp. MDT1-17]